MPDSLVKVLQAIYPNTGTKDYLVSSLKFQNDGYNCGPWVVEIFRYLVKMGTLPPENFDIDIVRDREHYPNLSRFRDRT